MKTQPSIAETLATAPDVDSLALAREILNQGLSSGMFQPNDRTLKMWRHVTVGAVCKLMHAAKTDRELAYIYNVTRTWEYCGGAEYEKMFQTLMRGHPSEAERLLAIGTVITGVTG